MTRKLVRIAQGGGVSPRAESAVELPDGTVIETADVEWQEEEGGEE